MQKIDPDNAIFQQKIQVSRKIPVLILKQLTPRCVLNNSLGGGYYNHLDFLFCSVNTYV